MKLKAVLELLSSQKSGEWLITALLSPQEEIFVSFFESSAWEICLAKLLIHFWCQGLENFGRCCCWDQTGRVGIKKKKYYNSRLYEISPGFVLFFPEKTRDQTADHPKGCPWETWGKPHLVGPMGTLGLPKFEWNRSKLLYRKGEAWNSVHLLMEGKHLIIFCCVGNKNSSEWYSFHSFKAV